MRKNNGYVAMTIVVGVSALLLIAVASRSAFLYRARISIFNSESKFQSLRMAQDCFSLAQIELFVNPSYRPSLEVVRMVRGEECTITAIREVDGALHVRTSASVNGAVTNLETELEKETLTPLRMTEYPNF